jgi:hypothetical protein
MKPSEFYETYMKIDYGNGKLVSPPKLRQHEKDFLDNAMENPNCQAAVFTRTRGRNVQVNVEALKRDMEKFPQYFIPAIQPKLDKWGNVLEENKQD